MTEATEAAAPELAVPITSEGRVASLDFIRGIAVLGILAANIVAFGLSVRHRPGPAALSPSTSRLRRAS